MEVQSELNKLFNEAMQNTEAGLKNSLVREPSFDPADASGRWTGKVIDNDDPDKLGRVKVLVFGYYDDLAEDSLPWAMPDIGYIGGTNGSLVIPEIGTVLRGYFDQGDIHKPVFDSIAFTQLTVSDTETNPSINKFEDYPHKMVLLETDNGEYMTLNKKTGETVFKHRSGASFTIDATGNITVYTGSSMDQQGSLVVNAGGNAEITVDGTANIKAKGNIDIDAEGQINLGKNGNKRKCNNYDACLFAGITHNIGNTNVNC